VFFYGLRTFRVVKVVCEKAKLLLARIVWKFLLHVLRFT